MNSFPMTKPSAISHSIAIMGSGGAGAITAGNLLLEAAGRAGWYGLMTRSVGPQIRGGEALAMVRLSAEPVIGHGDRSDMLVALDWQNADRFTDEIPLDDHSLVIAEADENEPPPAILASGARLIALPLNKLCEGIAGARANIIALGLLTGLLGLPSEVMTTAVAGTLARKGMTRANVAAAIATGVAAATGIPSSAPLAPPAAPFNGERWIITGNEATALGALRGGLRFAAVYPITPATDLSEWLAPQLQALGGQLIQAEDEIAAFNMVLGASYGGVPALTATSGPGLALMSETLGLAVAAEIPAVIINVMRGGPSTGIPTKSEQADLNLAVYGAHGDAPHLVLAPQSVPDCLFTTQWALHLAATLQCPAIVLSDQLLGQARSVCDRPRQLPAETLRPLAPGDDLPYRRYQQTASGVSPMAMPGTPGHQYTAEGLEHNERGLPSSRAADHLAQLNKRNAKLSHFDYGGAWAEIAGDGDTSILTWGSSTAAAREAASQARAAGQAVKVVSLRLLAPARPSALAAVLADVKRLLVVELSHSAQFYHYLRAHYQLPAELQVLNRPGPLPIRPREILDRILNWS
jgi:2-oxoglutarate ferredoxin oxidoreductase subunit alpha